MNTPIDNIIVNSCQYTPVYFIENPGVNQAASIVVNTGAPKPQSSNLKAFYESSGKLENNLLQSTENVSNPRPIKKIDSNVNVIGNNLKLANFLLPKNEFKIETVSEQQCLPYNNLVLKPVYVTNTSNNPSIQPTVPKLDVCSKIVRVKDIPIAHKQKNRKILPKMKPKEDTTNPTKTTSVQLIKLGETYHCLNELSDDQMKIVNHALKIFNSPKNSPKEPTYDPVTNTQFIYKVLSPKDIPVTNKTKVVIKPKKPEIKKEIIKRPEKKETKIVPEIVEPEPVPVETKVTRSGRKVRLPKNILPEETLQRPKKRSGTIVTCFQCSSEFSSLYRLQRHYEHHPTHIPARVHSNLFHCLLAIIKTGTEEDRAHIFLQQLEQLIAKIKSLIPCLMKSDGLDGKFSTISDDIGSLFGISPGKYNLNVDALSCVKDKDGHCQHNPAPSPSKPSPTWPPSSNEEPVNIGVTDDCARINSAEKWPTVSKRMECRKKPEQNSAKKIKLTDSEVPVELDDDDIDAFFSNNHKTDINLGLIKTAAEETDKSNQLKDTNINKDPPKSHIQFHSAHFDIRSSPIKPTSTVFRKFQINPEKLPKFDLQEIQPLLPQDNEFTEQINSQTNGNTNTLENDLYIQNNSELSKQTVDLNFKTTKDWLMKYMDNGNSDNYMKADNLINESTDFLKSNALIEPSLIHMKDDLKTESNKEPQEHTINENLLSNQESVLSLLSYPEATIRNNSVDFPLDLFSFSNS